MHIYFDRTKEKKKRKDYINERESEANIYFYHLHRLEKRTNYCHIVNGEYMDEVITRLYSI
jgi:hypothetical protein